MEKFYKYILCTYSVDACTMDLRVQLSVCCEEVREHVRPAVLFFFKSLALVKELWESLLKSCCLCVWRADGSTLLSSVENKNYNLYSLSTLYLIGTDLCVF